MTYLLSSKVTAQEINNIMENNVNQTQLKRELNIIKQ